MAFSSFADLQKGVGKVLYRIIMQCFKRGWSTGTSPRTEGGQNVGVVMDVFIWPISVEVRYVSVFVLSLIHI